MAELSLLWYNKMLFAKAGLNPSKPPANFAEILTDARAVNKLGHGVTGIEIAGNCSGCLGFATLPQIWAPKEYIIQGEPGSQTINIQHNSALRRTLTLYHSCMQSICSARHHLPSRARPGVRTSSRARSVYSPAGTAP